MREYDECWRGYEIEELVKDYLKSNLTIDYKELRSRFNDELYEITLFIKLGDEIIDECYIELK